MVAEYVPLLLYSALAILLTLPLNALFRPSRQFFSQTVQVSQKLETQAVPGLVKLVAENFK